MHQKEWVMDSRYDLDPAILCRTIQFVRIICTYKFQSLPLPQSRKQGFIEIESTEVDT